MTTDRWQRLESLCHAALARPASERGTFLADACGDDEELRAEAESLIARAESAASFLEAPVPNLRIASSLAGRVLGAYQIDAAIGAGGMGEIYRARDMRLGRDVAVKMLPAAWAADAQRRRRFEQEARAVATLNHPNICTIHDVGHHQGIDFLVMELVEGESLATRLAKGPLPLDQALARAIEIGDALDCAHRQGVVHRDLKPANIMLTGATSGGHTPHAKLLDFGLARIMPGAGRNGLAPAARVTEAGVLLGTVQYMAPEQIEGRPADARTDIFAFGGVLHEMVTGRRAFEGASTASLIAAILRSEPPPLLPRELGRIVRRCLAKDPQDRYQSARDLRHDLEEVKQGLDAPADAATRTGGRIRGRLSGSLAFALIVVGAATAAYIYWTRSPAADPVQVQRFQLQPPTGVELMPTGPASVLAVSADGQWVAFRGSAGENDAGLYIRSVGELDARKISTAGSTPFFSPDNRWLGFFADNAMFKMPLEGGPPQQICALPNVSSIRGASWGDDGTIVFSMDRRLWRVSSEGSAPIALTAPEANLRHYWPHVLPGGTAALFTVNQGVSDRWRRIAVITLESGETRTFSALSGTAPRYVPSGHLVYSRFGILYAVPFDLSRHDVTGEAIKILENVHAFGGSGSVAFDASASGSLVYIPAADRRPDSELVWLDRQGTTAKLLDQRNPYIGAAVDPTGRRVAVTIGEHVGEGGELAVYEIESGAWTGLTTGMAVGSQLTWSPDGQWIFFPSFATGDAELYRMKSRGGSPEQLTFDLKAWEFPGNVSPDGATLLFWKSLPSQGDLMWLPLEPRGTARPLTDSPAVLESFPAISPDGKWVAYQSDESGSVQIHVRPFPGPDEAIRVSSTGGTTPWWSRDGRELLYQRGPEVWAAAVEPGRTFKHRAPRVLFNAGFLSERSGGFLASGHGSERFLAVRREQPPAGDRRLVYVPNWIQELKQAAQRKQ